MSTVPEKGSVEAPNTTLSFVQRVFDSLARISHLSPSAESTEIPEEARSTLLTLHVLFPYVLLDSLDLLDRGLVIRVAVLNENDAQNVTSLDDEKEKLRTGAEEVNIPEHAAGHGAEQDESSLTEPAKPTTASSVTPNVQGRKRKRGAECMPHHTTHYVLSVRSHQGYSQAPLSKSRHVHPERHRPPLPSDGGGGANSSSDKCHQVHLDVWNCSCPAFAFAAFTSGQPGDGVAEPGDPPDARPMFDQYRTMQHEGYADADSAVKNNPKFGGFLFVTESSRGYGPSDRLAPKPSGRQPKLPPVCKHLLACLLGELCPGLFGTFDDNYDDLKGNKQRMSSRPIHARTEQGPRRGMRERTVSIVEAAGLAGSGSDAATLLNVDG